MKIPAPATLSRQGQRSGTRARRRNGALKGVGMPGQANPSGAAEPDSTASLRASGEPRETSFQEKLLRQGRCGPYRKPTQVVEESIQRCSGDSWLRN